MTIKPTIPANYRVLDGDYVVAFFVYSEHVLSFIQNCNRPVEHFKVQYMGGPLDEHGLPTEFTDLTVTQRLALV